MSDNYKQVKINRLRPYKSNARNHNKKQIKALSKSIQEFGFINPILIDDDFNVLAGHGRQAREHG